MTHQRARLGHSVLSLVAALIGALTGRAIRAERLDAERLGHVPAPMRAVFDHYDTSGLVSNDVMLRAVLEHPPRTLRGYFEELAAGS